MFKDLGGSEILIALFVLALIAGVVAIVVLVVRGAEHPVEHAVAPGTAPPVNEAGTSPSGWYPDPDDPSQRRYWDGNAWTKRTEPY